MDKLKPCPFCGCDKIELSYYPEVNREYETGFSECNSIETYITCMRCGVSFEYTHIDFDELIPREEGYQEKVKEIASTSNELLIARWNRRTNAEEKD